MRWLIYCRSYENRKYPIDPRVFSFSQSERIEGRVLGAGNMLYSHLSIPPFNTRPIPLHPPSPSRPLSSNYPTIQHQLLSQLIHPITTSSLAIDQ